MGHSSISIFDLPTLMAVIGFKQQEKNKNEKKYRILVVLNTEEFLVILHSNCTFFTVVANVLRNGVVKRH